MAQPSNLTALVTRVAAAVIRAAIAMLLVGGVLLAIRVRPQDAVAFDSGAEIRRFILWMAAAPYALTARPA